MLKNTAIATIFLDFLNFSLVQLHPSYVSLNYSECRPAQYRHLRTELDHLRTELDHLLHDCKQTSRDAHLSGA